MKWVVGEELINFAKEGRNMILAANGVLVCTPAAQYPATASAFGFSAQAPAGSIASSNIYSCGYSKQQYQQRQQLFSAPAW